MAKQAFETTQWSTVLAAGSDQTTLSRKALAHLCETYWFPLYAYIRRRGYPREEAEDLTQEFFTRLIERNALRYVDRDLGRFRSFLLASLNHFLADERDKARAQKRGGGIAPLSLDFVTAEGHEALQLSNDLTPEKVYERQWALAVLDSVLASLEDEYTRSGKKELFEHLKPALVGDKGAISYQELATQLAMSEGAVKMAAHRLRRRYRKRFREAIAQTIATDGDMEEEMQHLFAVLGS